MKVIKYLQIVEGILIDVHVIFYEGKTEREFLSVWVWGVWSYWRLVLL